MNRVIAHQRKDGLDLFTKTRLERFERGTHNNLQIMSLVRTGGIEPPRAFARRIFLPSTVFTAAVSGVCGLDYPFTLAMRLRCCPSSLYTFPNGPAGRAWLGIAKQRFPHAKGFPEFEQFYFRSFPRSTQSFKSVASTNSATPACIAALKPRSLRLYSERSKPRQYQRSGEQSLRLRSRAAHRRGPR